jgi:hypothetical protein
MQMTPAPVYQTCIKTLEIGNLEENAVNIKEFMASNWLAANLAKTDFMLINSNKRKEKQEKIQF